MWRYCFPLLVVCLLTSVVHAHPALKGIDKVYINLHPLDRDAEKTKIERDRVMQWIEGELRSGNIQIAQGQGYPQLDVSVQVAKAWWSWAVTYRLSLRNWAKSTADPNRKFLATTWETGGLFTSSKKKVPTKLESNLDEAIGNFIHDYQEANQ